MSDQRRTLINVGLGLIATGIVAGLITGAFGSGALGGISGGTLVFFGVVVLIVAALRGGGSGQQQQQQVVVVTGAAAPGAPAPAVPLLKCPHCARLNPMQATFCGSCGKGIAVRRPSERR